MLDTQKLPIWMQAAAWNLVGASDSHEYLENNSVQLTTDDTIQRRVPNRHLLWTGRFELLSGLGSVVFDLVKEEIGFDGQTEWCRQRLWFENFVRAYFSCDAAEIGVISFHPIRRPAHLRNLEDPSITIHQAMGQVNFRKYQPESKRPLTVGQQELPMKGAVMLESDDWDDSPSWAQVVIPRTVVSPRLGIVAPYHEQWLCLADPRHDARKLELGRLPAVPSKNYQPNQSRLRFSAIVNLGQVHANLYYTNLAIEIDHVSGKVMCLRWSRGPIEVVLGNSAPVERTAIESALQGKAR